MKTINKNKIKIEVREVEANEVSIKGTFTIIEKGKKKEYEFTGYENYQDGSFEVSILLPLLKGMKINSQIALWEFAELHNLDYEELEYKIKLEY